jgi:hypothetical protein
MPCPLELSGQVNSVLVAAWITMVMELVMVLDKGKYLVLHTSHLSTSKEMVMISVGIGGIGVGHRYLQRSSLVEVAPALTGT